MSLEVGFGGARLNMTETALLLGFREHDIAPLVAVKLLMPLGKPAQDAPKYFATVDIVARADDCNWLSEATKALAKYWLCKNQRGIANRISVPSG